MAVPVQNIYYLLCYAWDALEEAERIDVSPEQSLTLTDLFARVLISGAGQLLVRGVKEHLHRIVGIKAAIGCWLHAAKNRFSLGEIAAGVASTRVAR